jgi:hypothetical protein
MIKDTSAPYGYCPRCGGLGRSRERRPNGNDRCENGHEYPSKDAVKNTLRPKDSEGPVESERDGIVAWMRKTADRYAGAEDLVGAGYAATWRIIADLIEKKADKEDPTEL